MKVAGLKERVQVWDGPTWDSNTLWNWDKNLLVCYYIKSAFFFLKTQTTVSTKIKFNSFLDLARFSLADFYFSLDSDALLTDPDTIDHLVSKALWCFIEHLSSVKSKISRVPSLCLRGHCPGLLKPNFLCMSMLDLWLWEISKHWLIR